MRSRLIVAAAAVLATAIAAVMPAAQAEPSPSATAATPRETRAGLDPELVEGRGADVAFAEQEAEFAVHTGEPLSASSTGDIALYSPDRRGAEQRAAYTLSAEASGRDAVRLDPGAYVEFTLTRPANAITVRASIPDAPSGGGIESPLEVTVDGRHRSTMTLTSRYSWLYADYPFSNDPGTGWLNPDWWRPPTESQAKPHRPSHAYDEQRLLLDRTHPAGSTLRLTVPRRAAAAWTVVDLLDYEQVAPPARKPAHSVSILQFGADPSGRRDSSAAFDRAIAHAQQRHPGRDAVVYIPAGTFLVTRHIVVDEVAIVGAGNWHSIVTGPVTPRATQAPDGSRHDSPGFYGRWADDAGGSHDVRLADFAIVGEVAERIDNDQVNGVGGALSDSVVEDLYIKNTKVGIWLDGPGSDLLIRDNVIVDQIADGLNIRRGWTGVRATNNFVRNTGDDAMAMWSHYVSGDAAKELDKNSGNTFDHNTIQSPVLANGIAIYGGRDNTVSDNLIADPVREGSALHAGYRHGSTDFQGQLTFARNTTVRAGTRELNWDIGVGAIWFYALEGPLDADFRVVDSDFLDVSYNAIQFVSEWAVKDLYGISHVTVRDVRVDGAGTNVLNARAFGSATIENLDARGVGHAFTNNCGSFNFPPTGPEFSIDLLGGNDGGWDAWGTWCDDRPVPVEPPEPSAWL
ncbi:glycosyl hydrolase family 28-related protein [Jiangella alkaliphila]|uniref:Pectate lyase superfamily protein n=1 Tax=Jiangella alkaliphila TaxID=419479 RepID=A0A1H2JQE1_9ACTN|nr:glycosyl hydrolase family 28-related protein [Jiangella alkaliphila]SDU58764.1 Pectate lyase superfamily protein [Jiangella alkaliphila]